MKRPRAVQHRDTFVLAGIEEPNCFDVHEVDLLQIQRDRLATADLGLYLIEMVRSKLSAQPKSNFVRIPYPFDLENHGLLTPKRTLLEAINYATPQSLSECSSGLPMLPNPLADVL